MIYHSHKYFMDAGLIAVTLLVICLVLMIIIVKGVK